MPFVFNELNRNVSSAQTFHQKLHGGGNFLHGIAIQHLIWYHGALRGFDFGAKGTRGNKIVMVLVVDRETCESDYFLKTDFHKEFLRINSLNLAISFRKKNHTHLRHNSLNKGLFKKLPKARCVKDGSAASN